MSLKSEIWRYAEKNHINTDGETYATVYQKIVEINPRLHSLDELYSLANHLLSKLLNEYRFKATRVFAYYPLIFTKAYRGFDAVYLYEHIHNAMGATAESFMLLNRITEDLDKYMFQYAFRNVYSDKFGYMLLSSVDDSVDTLISYVKLIHNHDFDGDYCKLIEDDLKEVLVCVGDKYFCELDLTVRENIILLYEVCGIFYGFPEFRFDIFRDYDGYGNVVSVF